MDTADLHTALHHSDPSQSEPECLLRARISSPDCNAETLTVYGPAPPGNATMYSMVARLVGFVGMFTKSHVPDAFQHRVVRLSFIEISPLLFEVNSGLPPVLMVIQKHREKFSGDY